MFNKWPPSIIAVFVFGALIGAFVTSVLLNNNPALAQPGEQQRRCIDFDVKFNPQSGKREVFRCWNNGDIEILGESDWVPVKRFARQ